MYPIFNGRFSCRPDPKEKRKEKEKLQEKRDPSWKPVPPPAKPKPVKPKVVRPKENLPGPAIEPRRSSRRKASEVPANKDLDIPDDFFDEPPVPPTTSRKRTAEERRTGLPKESVEAIRKKAARKKPVQVCTPEIIVRLTEGDNED